MPPSKAAAAAAIFVIIATAVISIPAADGTITIESGGYKNVVVSISPDVPENADLLLGIYK